MGMKLLKLKYHVAAFLRVLMYKVLFGRHFSLGGGTTFRRFFNIYLEKGATIKIGRDCFFNHSCSVNALEKITIGDQCIFGENVKIYDHNHRFADVEVKIKSQGFATMPVTIGSRCWFGSNVVVLKGACIGNNCVIGAGCVIAQDIPDDTIVTTDRLLKIEKIRR